MAGTAYTGSQAFSGADSVLSINTGTVTTPVFTVINEVVSADLSGRTAKTADVTNFSSQKTAEFIAVLIDPGDIKLKMNYVATDPGQIALQAAFNGLTKTMFKLVLPLAPTQTTSGDSYAFSAVVTDYSFSVDPTKAITVDSGLKISGPLTFLAGA